MSVVFGKNNGPFGIEDLEPISVEEGEETEEIYVPVSSLRSVEYLKLLPPPDREGNLCYVFGEFSVTDDPSKPPVTFFTRSQDNPEILTLGDPVFGCLPLAVHPDFDRPLDGFRPIWITLKLTEKMSIEDEYEDDGDDGDQNQNVEIIADIEMLELNERSLYNAAHWCDIEGMNGFDFRFGYAGIRGPRVKVELRINKYPWSAAEEGTGSAEKGGGGGSAKEEDSSMAVIPAKRKRKPISIYGVIEAHQTIKTALIEPVSGAVRLYYADDDNPTPLSLGQPIPMQRRVVIAPIEGPRLCIGFDLYCIQQGVSKHILRKTLTFPIKTHKFGCFMTNKKRTHTKSVADGLISVSITFLREDY